MPDDISQKDRTRFSHVTIGQADADASACREDEEVMVIGAVDAAGAADASGTVDATDAADAAGTVDAVPQADRPAQTAHGIEDVGIGAPMPLAQRMVVVAALVGVVVGIAYLIWFWVFR
ncbi:MAG: hypothetical protein LBL86_02910 [Coriobacteriales bacterium]|jgi:hypothetical protein|nr:hypothetical protein [Coriobacteriales bacterium]